MEHRTGWIMTGSDAAPNSDDVRRQALEWVLRLTSGTATTADAVALEQWRAQSRAHRVAFAEANLAWDAMGEAAAGLRPADHAAVAPSRPSRRLLIGGALAAAAAAGAGVAVVNPPLALWPSLGELAADHRTGTGEQRRVELSDLASVQLNTRTSIAVRRGSDRSDQIELVAGEAAIATSGRITVHAGGGRVIAHDARFNMRCDAEMVRVACIEGELTLERHAQRSILRSGHQVAYDGSGIGPVVSADPDAVMAWQRGLLVFRQEPLAAVVAEINRYRPGRIILMTAELGRRPVVATFRIDRLDDVGDRLAAVFGLTARSLPGGIVLLS